MSAEWHTILVEEFRVLNSQGEHVFSSQSFEEADAFFSKEADSGSSFCLVAVLEDRSDR